MTSQSFTAPLSEPAAKSPSVTVEDPLVRQMYELLVRASVSGTTEEVVELDPSSGATTPDAAPVGSVIEEEMRRDIPAARVTSRGFYSPWDDVVHDSLRRHGSAWVSMFDDYVRRGLIRPHLAAATIEILGVVEDAATYDERVRLAERNLVSHSPELRDAAAQALSDLGDPSAAYQLRRAAVSEPLGLLRDYFQSVAHDLSERADRQH